MSDQVMSVRLRDAWAVQMFDVLVDDKVTTWLSYTGSDSSNSYSRLYCKVYSIDY